jgi:hypothetical protein
MERGLYIVTSDCANPAERDAYLDWYENVHFKDLLGIDGFQRGRLFESLEGADPSFAALYDLESPSVEATMELQRSLVPGFVAAGRISPLLQKRWGRSFVLRADSER